jgi:hypothetical protein
LGPGSIIQSLIPIFLLKLLEHFLFEVNGGPTATATTTERRNDLVRVDEPD